MPNSIAKTADLMQYLKGKQSGQVSGMSGFDFIVRTKQDMIEAVETFGFLPFFTCAVPGFSLEEHVARELWYSSGDEWEVWEWKGPVIRETGCAYGKFFENKAVFISREWFPDFANYRRDGYDFDARYEDGLASFKDKELYDLLDANAPISSRDLKRKGGYGKNGKTGFDTSVTRLQAQGYVTTSDFVYALDRNGNRYGWGIAEYTTPERRYGEEFTETVYRRTPGESYARLFEHISSMFPDVDERTIRKLLK